MVLCATIFASVVVATVPPTIAGTVSSNGVLLTSAPIGMRNLDWDPIWALPYPPRLNHWGTSYDALGNLIKSPKGMRQEGRIAWPILIAELLLTLLLGGLLAIALERGTARMPAHRESAPDEQRAHGRSRMLVWMLAIVAAVAVGGLLAVRVGSLAHWISNPTVRDDVAPR